MKKIYTLATLSTVLLFFGCSKDILKSYDKRIVGSWHITNVNRIGLSGDPDKLPFASGNFTFNDDGTLEYIDDSNALYTGSWDIRKRVLNEETIRSLQVSVVDFNTQQIISEHYDDINFVGTNHFKANIIGTYQTYVTHFRR